MAFFHMFRATNVKGKNNQRLHEVFKIRFEEPGVVVSTCNPSTGEANIGRLQGQDQPGLHSKTFFLNQHKTY
jgi:hypothetical protein